MMDQKIVFVMGVGKWFGKVFVEGFVVDGYVVGLYYNFFVDGVEEFYVCIQVVGGKLVFFQKDLNDVVVVGILIKEVVEVLGGLVFVLVNFVFVFNIDIFQDFILESW